MIQIYSLKKDGDRKLSKNFRVREFACKDGTDKIIVDDKLVQTLQACRDYFNSPITITSAYRSEGHNKKVGGVNGSQHTKGLAADIVVQDAAPRCVYHYLNNIMGNSGGVGEYANFVHIDTREQKARWRR